MKINNIYKFGSQNPLVIIMKEKALVVSAVLISMIFLASGCIQENYDDPEKINIIVSILPQKEIVRAVGGEHIKVNELIPPGASPATYELAPRDLINIENADIYFRIGHIPFEKANMERIRNVNTDLITVDASRDITLRYFSDHEEHSHEEVEVHLNESEIAHSHDEDEEHSHENDEEVHGNEEADDHEHGGVDPHLWLAPENIIKHTETVYETLAGYDPDNAEEYRKNANEYIGRLKELDSNLDEILSDLGSRKIIVFHPAWGYFADRYDLLQVSIEKEGKEPTAGELKNLIDEAKEEGIKVVFVQKQFSTDVAGSVAEEIGGVVIPIDPLAENYIENLETAGNIISGYLK